MGDAAAHARLSPSASKRWMTCTGSLDLEPTLPDSTSAFAEHGTFLHGIAENCLREGRFPTELAGKDMETVEYYLDYVRNVKYELGGTADLYIEQRLKLDADLFGTVDALVVTPTTLDVIDLKTGSGVKVRAHHNPQVLIYAMLARFEFEPIYGPGTFTTIRMHCVQPPLDHVDVWEIPAITLDEFQADLMQIVTAIKAGERTYMPSEDACRFCRGKAVCRARAEQNFTLAVEQFKLAEPPTLSLFEIAALLPKLDQIAAWTTALKDYAIGQALDGITIPGHKLVEGRSVRVWSSEDAAAAALAVSGVSDDQLYTKKLIGLGAAEKIIGKKHPVFAEVTVKSTGKPTLVEASDKRAAIEHQGAAVASMIEV